jgi:hypothetical protein
MPTITWKFHIAPDLERKAFTTTQGVYVDDQEFYDHLTKSLKNPNIVGRGMHIAEPDGSDDLALILKALKERYGFVPSTHRIVPKARRETEFGLSRVYAYSAKELNQFAYLSIIMVPRQITATTIGCDEPSFHPGDVTVEKYRPKKTDDLGFLFLGPFAVTEAMKNTLLGAQLRGFANPKRMADGVWRFGSDIILPKALTRLQNSDGDFVDPDDMTSQDKHWDGDGYSPIEIAYRRSEFASVGDFDIAYTYERVGMYQSRYFRDVIVSQRLRQMLNKMGHKRIWYAPVRLQD